MKRHIPRKFYLEAILVLLCISWLKSCNSYKSLNDFDYYFTLLAVKYNITDNGDSTNVFAIETNHNISFQGEIIKTKMIVTNFPTQTRNLKFVYAYSYDYENQSETVSDFNRNQNTRRNFSNDFFFPEIYTIVEIIKDQKKASSYIPNPIYFFTNASP